MDQRRLEYFIAVAEEMNFTRAAQRLLVTQSTLSAGLKSLEGELRVELVTRSTRSVQLTEAGAAFLPEARAALEALDRARAAVEPVSSGLRGSLTVGMLTSMTIVDVPALAGDFHRRHPGVRLRLAMSRRGTAGLAEQIKDSRMDVAFVGRHLRDEHLHVTPIKKYDLRLLVPEDHPLAGRSAVGLADVAGEPFIDMPLGFGQREAVDEAFARAELSRQVTVEVSDVTTIPEYVAHGLGVALLPEAFPAGPGVRALPLETELSWTLSVIRSARRKPTRALYAFMDLLPQHIHRERAF
ncbi:LysR substrate-binding domain-containing protein [Nonomuraea sp. NPDC049421]|uniref:LysR family transcriptional regulator n=1 Tax=Nonomuraea sp. NPDC049421 TaxID=3155275 RepID=UPI00343B218A